jgi:hypothetical protein
LPRRKDEERFSAPWPIAVEVSDARKLDLNTWHFRTRFGGLFVFVPYLAAIPMEQLLERTDIPGSRRVPAAHAMRSLLALKLSGNARHSHMMSHVFDEGLTLFAGLNVVPKRVFGYANADLRKATQ